ncbi:MAG: carbamoyltransferase HypF [Candidatus Sericytochromatia bacterium]
MQTSALRICVQGSVQGVGFRPFVYNLAQRLGLAGYVLNSPQGVEIVAEGPDQALENLLRGLRQEKPALVTYSLFESEALPALGLGPFEIRPSSQTGSSQAVILPDLATCEACREEIFAPGNRREGYPFTNCTHCGPRYSIIAGLPYDRPLTSMKGFKMCEACQAEYCNPGDRRFHAQPNACPDCGPELAFLKSGAVLPEPSALRGRAALQAAIECLQQGHILALKGLGGYQLLCDARNARAVAQLRLRKNRPDKPLAVMMANLDLIRQTCVVSEAEAAMLSSPMAPIVLLRRHSSPDPLAPDPLAPGVAGPDNPLLGIMLPTTPLHHLLLRALAAPLVATSGNLSQEPLAWQDQDALVRLGGIADAFLFHNRPILRPADDSVLRFFGESPVLLRRARGFAPLPLPLPISPQADYLALGAHLKNTVAFAQAQRAQAILSPHLGDLDSPLSAALLRDYLHCSQKMYTLRPQAVARDLHPDYVSSTLATDFGVPVLPVQHHYAHILACMAEHQLQGPVLGFAWDGLGLGDDGLLWGGEALEITPSGYLRRATFAPWPFAGGEKALRKPAYQALGWLWHSLEETLWEQELPPLTALSQTEKTLLRQALEKNLNCVLTSSVGRLFDALASLLDLCHVSSYEAQAAMALEFLAEKALPDTTAAPPPLTEWGMKLEKQGDLLHFPSGDLLRHLLTLRSAGLSQAAIALRFHQILAAGLVEKAVAVKIKQVVLTGGCFQNALLHQLCRSGLEKAGFQVYWPQALPPNDGGLALGQLYALLRAEKKESPCV